MRVQLLHNIEHPVVGPQPLIQIDECDPQDILMAGHRHDAAFNIGQEFFSAHCSAHGTCGDKEIVVIGEENTNFRSWIRVDSDQDAVGVADVFILRSLCEEIVTT